MATKDINTSLEDITYTFSPYNDTNQETNQSSGISTNSQLALYVVIGTFGLFGNCLVLLVMIKNANMRKSLFNRLLMYQSFLDGMASLFVIILCYIQYDVILEGRLGDLRCRLWMTKFMMWGLFVASNFNLVILTLERYVNIIYPFDYKRIVTSRKMYIIMVTTTLLCLIFVLTRDYNTSGLSPTGICQPVTLHKTKEIFRAVILLSVTIQFYLPLFIMLIAYGHIFIMLLNKTQQGLGENSSGNRNERLQKATRNILKTMIIVCALFFLCWVGNSTSVVLLAFDIIAPFFLSPWYHVSAYLCFLNCTVNPVIYSLQYEEFQQAAKAMFCKESTTKSSTELPSKSQTDTGSCNTVATVTSNEPNRM